MHRLSTLVTFLALSVGLASAQFVPSTAVYDGKYDNLNTPTTGLTCGGKLSGEFPFLNSFPQSPGQPVPPPYTYVGGSDTVSDLDQSECGKCYIVYNGSDRSKYIRFVPVDTSPKGLALSNQAFKDLTGRSPAPWDVDVGVAVLYESVDPSVCGF